ncbi:MAG: hypothetical protein DI598_18175, partial [Pseudopedobacter saltans]
KMPSAAKLASDQVVASNRNMSTSFSELEQRIDSVKWKMKSMLGGNSPNSGVLSMLGGGLGKVAGVLGVGISLGATMGFVKDSVSKAMGFDATKQTFGVLTGNRGIGNNLANNLNKLQQDTILGPEVFKSAQTLMSFGIQASKVVMIEKELGDVSMGNKDKFEALTLAYSQTQAAGRLMGQDLLQYINACFNPLQTMSERWKDFGLKQRISVGQLKDMMEQGKIGSSAVAKAFELATGQGGMFNDMMDQVSKTSYGQTQILEGQWENFKIGIGEAFMPIKSNLAELAAKTLDWINIGKTIPQTVDLERQEINTLVRSIISLNEKNDVRKRLLGELVNKYPDFFGKLDAEKLKNEGLLKSLDAVNKAYEKKYALESANYNLGKTSKDLLDAQQELDRLSKVLYGFENRQYGFAVANINMLKDPGTRIFESDLTSSVDSVKVRNEGIARYTKLVNNQRKEVDKLQVVNDISEFKQKMVQATTDAPQLVLKAARSTLESLGGNKDLLSEVRSIVTKIPTDKKGFGFHPKLSAILRLREIFDSIPNVSGSPSSLIDGNGTGKSGGLSSDVTTAGPRTINIYFNKEFIHELAINSYNVREGVGELEHIIEEQLKRVLYSAAQST